MHEKKCNKCGHACHCNDANCSECVNDVCGYCDCEQEDKRD